MDRLLDLDTGRRTTMSTGFTTPLPTTGFQTPFLNSSRWADFGKTSTVYGPDNEPVKEPGEKFSDTALFDNFNKRYDPYPAWSNEETIPINRRAIEAVFIQLSQVFGFQYDNVRNIFDYLMKLLDSRASRMTPTHALRSLHADYIGGVNSNFRKWYFAAQMDIDDSEFSGDSPEKKKTSKLAPSVLKNAEKQWCVNMNNLSATDCVIQLALYLLCWGEANNVRFMPECMCFIFKCCNDYYYSLDVEAPVENISPSFLDHVITPIYEYYRDQSYINVDDKLEHRDKDHKSIVGYDDINQLFWYHQGLERIVLNDKTKLMSIPPKERYKFLNEVNWKKAFYKTFKEKGNGLM